MKRRLILTITVAAFLGLASFNNYRFPAPIDSVITEISEAYLLNIETLKNSADTFQKSLDRASVTEQRKIFLALRKDYKKIEYLIAYIDPEFNKDYINGAPLPSLERKADDDITVLEPEGIQIIEELLFSDEYSENKEKISALSEQLSFNISKTLDFQKKVPFTHRYIFEAGRQEVIRIFTQNLAGFDSPSLEQVIEEQAIALRSVKEAILRYTPLLNKKAPQLTKELKRQFDGAINYLETNTDFEKFDRMYFLKNHINPIYASILDAQLKIGIETYYEAPPLYQKHAVNYYARNLFDPQFLNSNYYTRYPSDKDNKDVVSLGRALFFDPILSRNNKRSCASCHQPEKAFTDGKAKSTAFDFQGELKRNSPTLINAAYADRFFHDLRTDMLDDQIEHVIVDKSEFRNSFLNIFKTLEKSDEYVTLFKKGFPELGDEPINKYSVSASIAAYVASLSGFDSPFDKYVRDESEELSDEAIKGFNLFYGKAACGTCHFAPTFSGLVPPFYKESESEVLGVPADIGNTKLDNDFGRMNGVIKEGAHIYKHAFKTPTVRNAAATAPYMHNGVYTSLEQVVDFYNKGGGQGLGFDLPNQTLPPDPLELSDAESKSLVAFMESLTDLSSTKNAAPTRLPRFTDPVLNQRKIGGEY